MDGFTALLWKERYDKKLLFISDLDRILAILEKSFSKEDFVTARHPEKFKTLAPVFWAEGFEEEPMFIQVDAPVKLSERLAKG